MTRYTDEWLDAKLANIQRWKREEAARSAAKQSTAGAASPAGDPLPPVAAPAPSERDGPFAGACQQTPGARSRSSPAPILNATKADAQLTDAPGATSSHDGAAARRQPDVGVIAASSGTKYRNKRTNGYASKREAKRASLLKLMAEAGMIRNLREQVEFLLIPRQKRPNGTVAERSCSYFADFVYDEFRDGDWRQVVEDTKGFRTPDYIIKRKLVLFVHGIEIREV